MKIRLPHHRSPQLCCGSVSWPRPKGFLALRLTRRLLQFINLFPSRKTVLDAQQKELELLLEKTPLFDADFTANNSATAPHHPKSFSVTTFATGSSADSTRILFSLRPGILPNIRKQPQRGTPFFTICVKAKLRIIIQTPTFSPAGIATAFSLMLWIHRHCSITFPMAGKKTSVPTPALTARGTVSTTILRVTTSPTPSSTSFSSRQWHSFSPTRGLT